MPVYLCTAGAEEEEPWKHGIQVFAKPFAFPGDAVVHGENLAPLFDRSVGTAEPIHLENTTTTTNSCIRKVMHAQVVLVDDVCVGYGRYWVRLRWPGSKGGFAGYIAMQKVGEDDDVSDVDDDDDADDEQRSSQQQVCKISIFLLLYLKLLIHFFIFIYRRYEFRRRRGRRNYYYGCSSKHNCIQAHD